MTTDNTKFDELVKEEEESSEDERERNDPNRIIWGGKYDKASRLEKRQIKAMLGQLWGAVGVRGRATQRNPEAPGRNGSSKNKFQFQQLQTRSEEDI